MLIISLALLLVQLPDPIVPSPPRAAWPLQCDFKNEAYDLAATVRVATDAKQVVIDWGCGTDARYRETFDLAYWPTSATNVGDSILIVGGKKPSNGKTIIERWSMSWTDCPDASHPTDVTKAVVFVGGGGTDMRDPRCMLQVRGVTGVVLVLFDTGSLYRFDANGYVRLYTAQQIPKLALTELCMSFAAEHPTLGNTYAFHVHHSHSDEGGVLFYDTNKDGTIDQYESVDIAEWPQKVANVAWIQHF